MFKEQWLLQLLVALLKAKQVSNLHKIIQSTAVQEIYQMETNRRAKVASKEVKQISILKQLQHKVHLKKLQFKRTQVKKVLKKTPKSQTFK